jgi:septum formation protein
MKIILASASPRRKNILKKFIDFDIVPSNAEEKYRKNMKPDEVSMYLSLIKGLEVADRVEDESAVVLAADTIVYLEEILEKPKNREEARKYLKLLKNRKHSVYSGYSIIRKKDLKKITDYEKTDVFFGDYDDNFIDSYLDKNEYIDKAGAYAIQGFGSLFVKKIEGDYLNVMGFPLYSVYQSLKNNFNINLMMQEGR